MIITGLLNVILTLAKAIFSFIQLPSFPEVVTDVLETAIGYMADGFELVLYFFNPTVFRACLAIYLALIGFKYTYKFLMFVIGVIGRLKSGAEL